MGFQRVFALLVLCAARKQAESMPAAPCSDAACIAGDTDGALLQLRDERAKGNATNPGACVDQTGWDEDFANRCYHCALRPAANASANLSIATLSAASSAAWACVPWMLLVGL